MQTGSLNRPERPKIEFPKFKMADGRHFEKKPVKSSYLSNRYTDFDEIWHGDANWLPTGDRPLKFRISQNQDGDGRHRDKPQKSRYHSSGLTDLLRNLARLYKMGHLTAQIVKKLNFQNPRWRTAAILKTVTQICPLLETDR